MNRILFLLTLFLVNGLHAQLTIQMIKVDISCYGFDDGTATVAVSGGIPPYVYAWNGTSGSSTITNLAPGVYICTVTDALGMIVSESVSITDPPEITITSEIHTDVTCPGGSDGSASVIATGGTGALSYNWLPLGGSTATATNLSPGTYTCSVMDANGCVATSQAINIGTASSLDLTTELDGLSITSNEENASYEWMDCVNNEIIPGEIAQSFTATENGTYAVILSRSGGCRDTSDCVVIDQLGLKTNNLHSKASVYPNPSNGIFNIEIPDFSAPVELKILNTIGQTVYASLIHSEKSTIDLSGQTASIYYLLLETEDHRVIHQKIVTK